MKTIPFLVIAVILLCCEAKKENRLKIYGRKEITDSGDTIYHKVGDYRLTDQDSSIITPETFEGRIYVADFFFTSCPTICPLMKTQMLRVYEKYKENEQVKILSHTIDPKHDSVAVLREFANSLGVSSDTWHFVTGDKEAIYELGKTGYMVMAADDPAAPGGYLHSGAFLLIDKERRVRSIADGTVPEEVDRLMADMDKLLEDYAKGVE